MNRYTESDFTAATLITIDTQRDTLDGQPLEIPGTSAMLPNLRRLLATFRAHHRPVVHIVRLYKTDGSNVDLCRREAVECGQVILAPDTAGSQLAPGLVPGDVPLDCARLLSGDAQIVTDRELILYKPRWGAFYQTRLEELLHRWATNTTVFTGCNFPNCPRASIVEASERDFRVVVVGEAISGLDDRGKTEMVKIGATVFSTEELLAKWSRAA